jgi:putative ABC transport system permease protein
MKYFVLVWAGLWRKPARTTLTLLSLIVAFLLYCSLHGVTATFEEMLGQLGTTRLYVQNRVNLLQGLPISHLQKIESVPGVQAVSYYYAMSAFYQEPKNSINTGAVDLKRTLAVFPELSMPREQLEAITRTRTAGAVGKDLAERWGWRIGDRIPLRSPVAARTDGSDHWEFDVAGIYDTDAWLGSSTLFINFDYFDAARAFGKGRVMMYYVKVDDESRATAISESIDRLFANTDAETQTQNERDWISGQGSQSGNVNFFLTAIIGSVLFTILFLIGNTMMQSVRERFGEFAVLRACGYPGIAITGLVIAESAVLCLSAALVGIGIATIVFPSLYRLMGLPHPVAIPAAALPPGLGIAVLLAVVSSLPPAWRLHQLNVVDALAGRR